MYPYLSEFIGTAMLVLMGDSVCASNALEGSLFKGSGAVYTMLGWGLAVGLPAMCFGAQSGASFNPVLTIGLAVAGSFPWALVPGYILAQMCGGFVGACLMWFTYKDQFAETDDPGTILGVFCTGPAIPNTAMNIFQEAIATFMLVFFITNITATSATIGLNYIIVAMIINSCGYSLGATTGFAMNPARDTAPRLAHQVLPIAHKGGSNWGYAFVPIVGPLIGAICGALFGTMIANWPALVV